MTYCPYGTYQRALTAAKMSIAKAINNPDQFKDALLNRLSPKARADSDVVALFVESATGHLERDFNIMLSFRL